MWTDTGRAGHMAGQRNKAKDTDTNVINTLDQLLAKSLTVETHL